MQTAAAYIRVSTEDQTEYSPDSQLKKIQEYAHAHQILLSEDHIYVDEGISGRQAAKRPAFLQMIGTARQKPRPFDVILVWKFSRFARNRQDSILYKSMLRKECGIQVISITEQLSDDPTAILIEALLEAMDEYYSINLAQEVRRGMYEKFSRGGVVSVPPFGYRMGAEHFEPEAEQAPLIPMIYQDFLKGLSCRQIAAKLNALGVRTSRGNLFESRTITYILSNPTYTGKLRRTSSSDKDLTIVTGHHPPLIDESTYQAVQHRLSLMRASHAPHARTAPASYMLKGLVRCGQCGSTLTPVSKGNSLQCHKYTKGQCTQSHHIRLQKLNQAVLSRLEADQHPGDLYITLPDPPVIHTADPTNALIQRAYQRLNRIQIAYETGIDTLEEYASKKAQIQKEIDTLKKDQISSAPLTKTCILSFHQAITLLRSSALTESAKNELLRAFVSHIIFTRPQNTIQIVYYTIPL